MISQNSKTTWARIPSKSDWTFRQSLHFACIHEYATKRSKTGLMKLGLSKRTQTSTLSRNLLPLEVESKFKKNHHVTYKITRKMEREIQDNMNTHIHTHTHTKLICGHLWPVQQLSIISIRSQRKLKYFSYRWLRWLKYISLSRLWRHIKFDNGCVRCPCSTMVTRLWQCNGIWLATMN